MRPLRLQYQITLATFLPLIVFVLLSGGVGWYALRHIQEELVLQRQTALTEVAAAGVAGNLRGYVRLLEATAAELGDYAGQPARQAQILADRATTLAGFSAGVLLLDAQGRVYAATPPGQASLGLDANDRPYFQDVIAAGAPVFSTVFQDEPAGFDAVVIAVPIRSQGAVAGALLGEFALARRDWARDLNLLRTPQGGFAYLIDSASVIIYHPDAGRIGAAVQTDPELWRMVLAGQARSMIYRPNGTGARTVVSYAPIPGITWGVITEEPWQAILATIRPYEWAMSGLLAAGLLLAFAALVLSVRQVTRPLNALVASAHRVALGRPFEALKVEGPPDLRTTLEVVNQMVARLADQQAALRGYARQVLRGTEEERLRLSRDLHDETVQDLIALGQRIELAGDALEENPAAARRDLRELQVLAGRALTEVRRMSNNLRPSILEDLGLPAAVQVLTRGLAEALPCAHVGCEIVGEPARLAPELELTAFRVAQEALTNVRKHAASATRVSVSLLFEPESVVFLVEDDGPGFVVPAEGESLVREGHLGLSGMAERAELFGGRLIVSSKPGRGTTVSLRLPREGAEAG